MRTFNRRHAFQLIAQLSLYGSIISCHRSDQVQQEDELVLLSGMAYELMPYPALPSQLYLNAAENILARDPVQAREGVSALREMTGNTYWSGLRDSEREEIIENLQNLPFFVLVRTVTIETLYREQAMFDLLGYGGSAIEHGGYINRGFDDINWLPGEIN